MQNILRIISDYSTKGTSFQLHKLKSTVSEYLQELPGISNDLLEDLYLVKENLQSIPACPICGKNRLFRDYKKGYRPTCHDKICRDKNCADSIKKSFQDKYGVDNPSLVKSIQQKREQTFIDNYGVSNPYAADAIKAKIKQTFIDNYGCDNPSKSQAIKDRIVDTNFKKYGVGNTYQIQKVKDNIKEKYGDDFGFGSPSFKEKSRQTFQDKYGVDHIGESAEAHKKITETQEERYGGRGFSSVKTSDKIRLCMIDKYGVEKPMDSPEIRAKIIETCLVRYGSTSHMHDVTIFEKVVKSSYKIKKIKMPSGKIYDVQGYEPFVIQFLLNNNYQESDIIVNNKDIEKHIGKIYYDNSEKQSRYYPDIYIKSENKIIEVKSEYTYIKNESINITKRQACVNNGLGFEFIIVNQEFLIKNSLI